MAGQEEPRISNKMETKDRADVEMHELSEESHIEGRYMGTGADRLDMIMLGRKQVLRVRAYQPRHGNLAQPRCFDSFFV